MTFQFSPDFDYLYIKNDDGSIAGIPVSQLTEAEKLEAYEAIAQQQYA